MRENNIFFSRNRRHFFDCRSLDNGIMVFYLLNAKNPDGQDGFRWTKQAFKLLPHRATPQGRDYRRHVNSSRSNTQAAENFLVRKFEMCVSLICGCWLLIAIVCYSLISEAVCTAYQPGFDLIPRRDLVV